MFRIESGAREVGSEYHELTSDKYFESVPGDDAEFHVIYLDGLHTFEQTLRDLMNALDCLRREGVIVIDDIFPNSYHASLANFHESAAIRDMIGDGDHSWMGDVYRLVYFIQTFLPRFDYASVQDNLGQLVMWRGKRSPGSFVERRVEDISRLEFRHLVMQREAFNFMPNSEIARRAKRAILRQLG
jgi:hypothetical protein